MLRNILAALAGYLVIAVSIFALFTTAYLLMGEDRVYREGSYEVTAVWIALSLAVSYVAAELGGMACQALARTIAGRNILIAIIVAMGIGQIVAASLAPEPEMVERAAGADVLDAAANSIMPGWIDWANPALGVLGVLLGSWVVRRMKARS